MKMCRLSKPEIELIENIVNFTEDEYTVFRLLLRDRSISEISMRLSRSERTVSRIIREVKNKVELIYQDVPIWCKEYLTIGEATKVYNLTDTEVRKVITDYPLAVLKVGDKILIRKVKFSEYLDMVSEI